MKIRGIKIQDVYTVLLIFGGYETSVSLYWKGENQGNGVRDMAIAGCLLAISINIGSTYSFFLMKKCSSFQKHVLIDIERIHQEPLVGANYLLSEFFRLVKRILVAELAIKSPR